MAKIEVRFYKTITGVDRLVNIRHFDEIEDAMAAADKWEAQTPDNYAVFA